MMIHTVGGAGPSTGRSGRSRALHCAAGGDRNRRCSEVGIGWGAKGRRPASSHSYFADRALVCAVNLVGALRQYTGREVFAEWSQIRQVLSIVIPTTVYVFAVPILGMYVSSGLLIAVFMKWLGRYSWPIVLALSIGVPFATFFMFERWFLVPLPKEPLEDWLGL
jgi:hypothetical protein